MFPAKTSDSLPSKYSTEMEEYTLQVQTSRETQPLQRRSPVSYQPAMQSYPADNGEDARSSQDGECNNSVGLVSRAAELRIERRGK